MPKTTTAGPDELNSSFASRRAAREAREAVEGVAEPRPSGTVRAGVDQPQPSITVTHR